MISTPIWEVRKPSEIVTDSQSIQTQIAERRAEPIPTLDEPDPERRAQSRAHPTLDEPDPERRAQSRAHPTLDEADPERRAQSRTQSNPRQTRPRETSAEQNPIQPSTNKTQIAERRADPIIQPSIEIQRATATATHAGMKGGGAEGRREGKNESRGEGTSRCAAAELFSTGRPKCGGGGGGGGGGSCPRTPCVYPRSTAHIGPSAPALLTRRASALLCSQVPDPLSADEPLTASAASSTSQRAECSPATGRNRGTALVKGNDARTDGGRYLSPAAAPPRGTLLRPVPQRTEENRGEQRKDNQRRTEENRGEQRRTKENQGENSWQEPRYYIVNRGREGIEGPGRTSNGRITQNQPKVESLSRPERKPPSIITCPGGPRSGQTPQVGPQPSAGRERADPSEHGGTGGYECVIASARINGSTHVPAAARCVPGPAPPAPPPRPRPHGPAPRRPPFVGPAGTSKTREDEVWLDAKTSSPWRGLQPVSDPTQWRSGGLWTGCHDRGSNEKRRWLAPPSSCTVELCSLAPDQFQTVYRSLQERRCRAPTSPQNNGWRSDGYPGSGLDVGRLSALFIRSQGP
ncbi:unnamed protein product [Gadus morhua 'NCC']